MSRIFTTLLAFTVVGGGLCVAMGGQNFRAVNPDHPVFSALTIGQLINVSWEPTGCVISDSGGIKKVEAIGANYLVYSEAGMTYYLYINQVKLVVVRPGGRIVEPPPAGNSGLDAPDSSE